MITTQPATDLEIAKDALCGLLLGPEFATVLRDVWSEYPVIIPIRFPEVGYIDEVKTLGGYPAFELVSGPTEHGPEDPAYLHEISLQWTVNGDNEQIMAREIMRFVVATRRFFEKTEGSLLPWVGGKFWVERSDTGPTSEGRDDPFVKSASLRVMWRVYGA